MIKLKKYNSEQIKIIQDVKQFNYVLDNLSHIAFCEELSLTQRRVDMLKCLMFYMFSRRKDMVDAGVSKKDADYVIKNEIKAFNLLLKEFKDALPKNN